MCRQPEVGARIVRSKGRSKRRMNTLSINSMHKYEVEQLTSAPTPLCDHKYEDD